MLIVLDADPRSANAGVWCTMFFIYMTYTLLALHVEECTVSGLLLGFTQVQFQDFSYGLLRYSFRTSPRVYSGTVSGLLLGFTQVQFQDFS